MCGLHAGSVPDLHSQSIFEQSPLPQAIAGLDLRLVAVNAAMSTLLGRPADELIGLHVDSFKHPDAPTSRACELLDDHAGGMLEYERVYHRPDDVEVPVRLFATLVRDGSGTPQHISAFVVDLTDQKRAEEALRGKDALFQPCWSGRRTWPWSTHRTAPSSTRTPRWPASASPRNRSSASRGSTSSILRTGISSRQRSSRSSAGPTSRCRGSTGTSMPMAASDGSKAWLTNKIKDPQIGGIVINVRDVTVRVESERALHESQERYRVIVETAQEGIWVANPQGQTVYVNPKMADIAGFSIEQLHARGVLSLLDVCDAAMVTRRLLDRQTAGTEEYELQLKHPDGTPRSLLVRSSPLWDADQTYVGSLGMVSDITEMKRAEWALRRQALYDDLTGLPNRTLLHDRLEQAKGRHARGETESVVIVFLDVDQFNLVNDSMGYEAGDELLRQLAERLTAAALPGETVARFGGNEFVFLTEGRTPEQARALSRLMLDMVVDDPFEVHGRHVQLTASVGIACSAVCPSEELLQAAEAAMYVAKRCGDGEAQMFDVSLADEARTRFDLNVELRAALTADELELWYQPIVEIATGRLLGLEALARWNHPTRGFVRPDLFVSVAEQGGFVRNLDRWVLRRATAELSQLRGAARWATTSTSRSTSRRSTSPAGTCTQR